MILKYYSFPGLCARGSQWGEKRANNFSFFSIQASFELVCRGTVAGLRGRAWELCGLQAASFIDKVMCNLAVLPGGCCQREPAKRQGLGGCVLSAVM